MPRLRRQDLDVVPARERREDAQRRVPADRTDDLRGAVDGRRLGRVDERLARVERGRGRLVPDAPRVEQLTHHRERVGAREEERALLREEGLERREVEHDGVGLDLPEVGQDRQVERQLVRHGDLGVEAARDGGVPAVHERARAGHGLGGAVTHAAELEGAQLPGALGAQVGEIVDAPEQGDVAAGAAREERPVVGLLARLDEAPHLEAPVLERQRVEAQHVERDAELDGVAARRVGGLALPDGVPVRRVVEVVEVDGVAEHAGGVDAEVEGAHAVAAAVDVEPDPVRGELGVAPHEPLDDGRVDLLAVDADVDRVVVVEDPHLRALAGRRALVGEVLGEGVGGHGAAPGRIVELAVDLGALARAHGAHVGPNGGHEGRRGGDRGGRHWHRRGRRRLREQPRDDGSDGDPESERHEIAARV